MGFLEERIGLRCLDLHKIFFCTYFGVFVVIDNEHFHPETLTKLLVRGLVLESEHGFV